MRLAGPLARARAIAGARGVAARAGGASGVELVLMPQRAAWIESSAALLVADVHLGKAASYRALGVPVPERTTDATLDRLDSLVAALRPRVLCVLGDLLHGPAAQAPRVVDALVAWRVRHRSTRVVLVRGNHDDRAGDPPARCGIEVVDEPWRLDGLALCHVARPVPDAYAIGGHLHPAYRLRGRADAVRLPCFWLRPAHAVLPAFGEFTGGWSISPDPGDDVFITDGERVHALPQHRGRPT